ncbi:hypothetical protein [Flexithrix dorotheae]|uniref:hypothetical protein n=1 Tax=Flexithrix dorotheae TaxID=70993 RepID=UPI0003661EE4|nr:hypothetical protein [Flexithrix dorotheae]
MRKIPTNKVFQLIITSFLILNFSGCNENEPEPDNSLPIPELRLITVNSTDLKIDWEDLKDATDYQIDVALDEGFTEILPDYNGFKASNSEITIQDLTPSTTYFIRARGLFEGEKTSENSNVIEAVTAEAIACNDPSKFVFIEKDGVVKVEFENAKFGNGWELKTGNVNTSGRGYMVWNNGDFFPRPGSDLATFKIKISTPGTYQFIWNSAVTIGTNGTEHNDTWLKFPDASDFYAEKNGTKVYPKGSGKTPNPEGASQDGWFKVYRSGNDVDFKWQARTYDNDPHLIYVMFDEAGTYTMQISARSYGHGIDKFALFLESLDESTVTNTAEFSEVICE